MSTDLIDFSNIANKFCIFLRDKDNVYKYREYYLDYIYNSIEEEIEYKLIAFILFIQKEGTTCHGDNRGERLNPQCKTELEIISDSFKLLEKFKYSKIAIINSIFKMEQKIKYENDSDDIYGKCELPTNLDLIKDINYENISTLIYNIDCIYRLKKINNYEISSEIIEITQYLAALRVSYINLKVDS
jgi:hypothetical protein